MKHHERELGTTETGEKLIARNLRDLRRAERTRYAEALVVVSQAAIENGEPTMGRILMGSGIAKRNYRRMTTLARQANALCDLIFVNDELIGATRIEYKKAGDTPIAIARPTRMSRRIEYWLTGVYKNDIAANDALGRVVVAPDSESWQWDYVRAEHDPRQVETYGKLGLTMLLGAPTEITTVNGGGVQGYELWALPPSEDDAVLAMHMGAIDEEVRIAKAAREASRGQV